MGQVFATSMLAVTRRGAALLNELSVDTKFGKKKPLAIIKGDMESNPENYDKKGNLKKLEELKPLELPVYKGMRVYLTKNVRKEVDFVNGMLAIVEAYDDPSHSLRVRTQTGFVVYVHPWTDTDLGNKTYMPVRAGYPSHFYLLLFIVMCLRYHK